MFTRIQMQGLGAALASAHRAKCLLPVTVYRAQAGCGFFLTPIYKPLLYRDGPDLVSILRRILADMKSKLGFSPEVVIVLCEVPSATPGAERPPLMLKHELRSYAAENHCLNSGCRTEPWFQSAELFYRDFIFSADISTINQNSWFMVEKSQRFPIDAQWPLVLAM